MATQTSSANDRPGLEKSWDAFYAIVCDFLRGTPQVGNWLRDLQARVGEPKAPDPAFWRSCFPDHHAAALVEAAAPLESIGALLAVRLPPPQVFRFAFPWPWSEFQARRTLFGDPGSRPETWMPPGQTIRHIHTQMNFSFGDPQPELQNGVPIYSSMMRAAFESGATVHCCDVFTKLATDGPQIYALAGPDGKVNFRSVEGQAQRTFGLQTVIYVPCKYEQREGTARGFCVALYSPFADLFGEHPESFEILAQPTWVDLLRSNVVLERYYDALVECDQTARFTTRIIMTSLYQNNLARAKEVALNLSHILEQAPQSVLEKALATLRGFVNNSHIAAFEFLAEPPTTTELSASDVDLVIYYLRRVYQTRADFVLKIDRGMALRLAGISTAGEPLESRPMANRLKTLLQAYIDNAAAHAIKIDDKSAAIIRLEPISNEKWMIEVSNEFEYPDSLEKAVPLERYWWIREALAPPGPRPDGPRSGGIQLFLIACLCRNCGLEPEFIIDVPAVPTKTTYWRSRVSFIMR